MLISRPRLFPQLLLQMNPYHVDSLLQLSDVCRMQEDQEMARDLIGKGAGHGLTCSEHYGWSCQVAPLMLGSPSVWACQLWGRDQSSTCGGAGLDLGSVSYFLSSTVTPRPRPVALWDAPAVTGSC